MTSPDVKFDSRQKYRSACFSGDSNYIPVDFLAHPSVIKKLKQYHDIHSENELLDMIGADFYYLSCRDISQNESLQTVYRGPDLEYTSKTRKCPFGIGWTRGVYQSKFAVDEAITHPLASAQSAKDILDCSWPKIEWFEFDSLQRECDENSNRVIIGGFWAGILGDSYRMCGFENFLLNIAANPPMIKTLVDKMTDFYCSLNKKLFEQLGDRIDIWFFGNDFGTQNGLLISKDMIHDFFMDNLRKLCDLAHSYGIKVMMHSCGAISEIIPMLIDVGVNILDPIQVTAQEMCPRELKRNYGNDLVFHGGIDTQQILPFGNAQQVEDHCLETIRALGHDGGYVFAPTQVLGPDIPLENINTMYKAVGQYNQR